MIIITHCFVYFSSWPLSAGYGLLLGFLSVMLIIPLSYLLEYLLWAPEKNELVNKRKWQVLSGICFSCALSITAIILIFLCEFYMDVNQRRMIARCELFAVLYDFVINQAIYGLFTFLFFIMLHGCFRNSSCWSTVILKLISADDALNGLQEYYEST